MSSCLGDLFLDKQHMERFGDLINKDNTSGDDRDRIAMFYIISGNADLMSKVDALYDFKRKEIYCADWTERADFSGGATRLIRLAYNLFNGYECNPYNTFDGLDAKNRELAYNAIRVRFPY